MMTASPAPSRSTSSSPTSVPGPTKTIQKKNKGRARRVADPVLKESVRNGVAGIFFTTKDTGPDEHQRGADMFLTMLRERYHTGQKERDELMDTIRVAYEEQSKVLRHSIAISIEGYSLIHRVPVEALEEAADKVKPGLASSVIREMDELTDTYEYDPDLAPTHTFNTLELEDEDLYQMYLTIPGVFLMGSWRATAARK